MNSLEWIQELNRRFRLYEDAVQKAIDVSLSNKDADLTNMVKTLLPQHQLSIQIKLDLVKALLPDEVPNRKNNINKEKRRKN